MFTNLPVQPFRIICSKSPSYVPRVQGWGGRGRCQYPTNQHHLFWQLFMFHITPSMRWSPLCHLQTEAIAPWPPVFLEYVFGTRVRTGPYFPRHCVRFTTWLSTIKNREYRTPDNSLLAGFFSQKVINPGGVTTFLKSGVSVLTRMGLLRYSHRTQDKLQPSNARRTWKQRACPGPAASAGKKCLPLPKHVQLRPSKYI